VPFGSLIASAVSANSAFGARLSAIAAAYTIGLNEDPGCRLPSMARSNGESL
jgi:hypothetical protein